MMKLKNSVRGVTLLEIMLVLAIAAMVIVMSVRYYQSASANQQANGILQMIQGVTAAADGLAQGTGSYSVANVSTTTIQPLMPNNSMTTPWGGEITVSNAAPSTYDVSITAMPGQVCALLSARLAGNPKYTSIAPGTCPTSGSTTFSYTYTGTN